MNYYPGRMPTADRSEIRNLATTLQLQGLGHLITIVLVNDVPDMDMTRKLGRLLEFVFMKAPPPPDLHLHVIPSMVDINRFQ